MAQGVTEVQETERDNSTTQEMDVETVNASVETMGNSVTAVNGEANTKRAREVGSTLEEEETGDAKKQKVEKSVEEQRLEKSEGDGRGEDDSGRVTVGPKSFGSSVEMFDYFFKFLHYWPPNLDVNKYEHKVLLELLKKGHVEPENKIGKGIRAFQVRYHPHWKSRCFFLIREDESVDDLSFRKCVHHILPLPENMQVKPDVNKALGGPGRGHGKRGGGGGRGGWRGHGRGGRSRN